MGLQIPAAGSTPGPEWFAAIINSLNIIDAHNHSIGEGVQVNQDGLFFTGPVPFEDQALTEVQYLQFIPSTVSSLYSVFVNGVDLYYYDGNGNTVQLTSGGAVNATSSGIISGTATASFVGPVLVVNAAATTPANIEVGSVFLGNNSAGSYYYEVSPPGAMGAPIGPLTLPTFPSGTKLLTLTSTGTMAASTGVDGTSITGLGGTLAVGPQTQAATITNTTYTANTGTTLTTITGSSLTITATGRPVYLQAAFDIGGTLFSSSSADCLLAVLRGSTRVDCKLVQVAGGQGHSAGDVVFGFFDPTPGTGSVTYNFQASGGVNCTGPGASLTTTAFTF